MRKDAGGSLNGNGTIFHLVPPAPEGRDSSRPILLPRPVLPPYPYLLGDFSQEPKSRLRQPYLGKSPNQLQTLMSSESFL